MQARTACRIPVPLSLPFAAAFAVLALGAGPALAAAPKVRPVDPEAVQRLLAASGGRAEISFHPATGAARFVRLGRAELLARPGATAQEAAARFLADHGAVFGLRRPAEELALTREKADRLGQSHLTYRQVYRGLPVFGASLRLHLDEARRVVAANGAVVPNLRLDPTPELAAAEASEIAADAVRKDLAADRAGAARATQAVLMVFRAGLIQGVPGSDHLVWQVEVSDGRTVKERVYVDAHHGMIVDRINAAPNDHLDLYREAYTPDFVPEDLVWKEGDPYPTGDVDIDNVVSFSGNVHALFSRISGGEWISWDGEGAHLWNTILPEDDPTCPNAYATGANAFFCPGVTGDDVVAHEWTHNYTGATHDLIYQWQPGALNEAYSDMFGAAADEINGPNLPNDKRLADKCTVASIATAALDRILTVTAPPQVAGEYAAMQGAFGGDIGLAGIGGELVLVDDGAGGSPSDGCEFPFLNDISGKVAMIDRGTCEFGLKSLNAEMSGAIAVIIINNQGDGLIVMGAGAFGDQVTIPPVMIGQTDGTNLKAALPGVLGDLTLPPDLLDLYTDPSYRWLIGEDDPGFGGPIRDMWNPTCHANPGKVTDVEYWCGADDAGGVHTNSGVPNHAFALVADGGTYNGQTVAGLGWSKTAAIYWRAMSVYQVPTTDFPDHADALEQSCQDLIGASIYDIYTGRALREKITSGDCGQVSAAIAAVELRTDVPCDFEPLLKKDPPPLCGGFGQAETLFFEDFETDPIPRGWTVSNEGVNPEYIPRDWEFAPSLPGDRAGAGMFALDSLTLGDCVPGSDDQSGAMYLDAPAIVIPPRTNRVAISFQHYVATEAAWDGGNVKVRLNDGVNWKATLPRHFIYNPYNLVLEELLVFPPNGNPLGGEWAFSGADEGKPEGSWGESQLILPSDVALDPGDQLHLRFAFGVDGCNGLDGWYLDDLRVFTCRPLPPPAPEQGAAPAPMPKRRLPREHPPR